ncbi:MAG: hypothetical protein AT718_06205 [Vulcanisaeta sp. JCHS_4]|nr:MAG: hypothetical protein AT718_06205 [Vulcanisaeta sp. JCHS_4]
MINRMRIGRRAPILLLMALAAVATIALADVIFVYTGTINVKPMTTTPLSFSTGPNAGPTINTAAAPYINFTGGYGGFTVTLVITNSSAVYYYEAGQLTVNTGGYIYVSSVTTSYTTTTAPVQSMTIYIQGTSCSFQVITNGGPATTPTSSCSLSPGTYYISIKVVPNLPVTSSSTETVTVNFGYNVISGASVLVPT